MNKRLVILGAGIGGLSVIKELRESGVPLNDLDITIVDDDFSHFLGFTLPWVMRGWRDHDSVCIHPNTKALSGITTVVGSVQAIDPEMNTVTLADITEIPFDALVIATGARNAVGRIPGLQSAVDNGVAVHYYSAHAAADAHRALQNFNGGKLVFLVTSAPYRCPVAPYEGALLAADLLRESGARSATQIAVYSPEKQPMPSAGPYAGPELVELLNNNDIDFFGEHSVVRVNADERFVEFEDGTAVGFDLLVFVPPHEPAVTLDRPGWIAVDTSTMQTQHPGIFAIGDTTAVTSPSGRPLPKAAIFAKNGAKAAAGNILRYLGKTDRTGGLSGEGYCYIDTGAHTSARGKGDFFTVPHPEIHLTPPSSELHHEKKQEEQDWRALWECQPRDAAPERGATARLGAGAEPAGQVTMEHQHRDHIRGTRIETGLSGNLVASKNRHPDRVALRCGDLRITFAEFDSAAARVATLLDKAGIEPGDRVGVMLPNTPAFAIAFYGIMYRGAVAVPMNPLLKAREVAYYLSNSAATALFAAPHIAKEAVSGAEETGAQCWIVDDAELAKLTADLPEQGAPVQRNHDDTAVILYTSGTTGKPKGAMLTHAGLGRNAEVSARTVVEIGPGDVVMGCLPLFHIFGLSFGLTCAVLAGAMLTLIPRFDPGTVLEVIEREGVTVFGGVPTMYSALLGMASEAAREATRSLRVCVSGGAALPVQVLSDFENAFGCLILEGYGLTESSPAASFNHPHRPRKAGSVGTPIEGVQMRVVDLNGAEVAQGQPGEVQIRGHNVMKGYWNLPEATKATITPGGWLNTGDVGRVDTEGYFYIVDRTKDLIIRGGYNVYPREIEEVLYEHPAVAEAAVIGIPHDSLGEEVGAAVALKKGQSVDPDELRDYVKARVAAYKYPRRIWLLDELPKGATGKVQKRDITAPASEMAP